MTASSDEDDKFEDVLDEQEEKMRALARIVVNYKKSGCAKMTVGTTRGRIEVLKEYWQDCRKLHKRLKRLRTASEKEHVYFKEEKIVAAEEQYLQDLGELYDLLRKLEPAPTEDSDAPPTAPAAGGSQLKFKKMDVPKFAGDVTQWDTFRDLFESMIHNDASMPKIQKFHYLRESLSDEALRLIDTKRITAANYDSAWEALKNRYDDEIGLVWAYLKILFDIPAMKDPSGKQLQRLTDETTRAREGLLNLRRQADQWDYVLVFMTVGKLESETRKHFELYAGTMESFPTFDEVIDTLNDHARRLSRLPASLTVTPPAETSKQQRNRSAKAHVSTTVASSEESSQRPICPSCQASHSLAACQAFRDKPVFERREYTKQQALCYNCLKIGHSVNSCPSAGRCKQCKRKHHTLLHITPGKSSETTNRAAISPSAPRVNPSTKGTASEPGEPSTPMNVNATAHLGNPHASVERAVLLATARVRLRVRHGRNASIRALLDQGSEVTFVSESVAQALRAPRLPANLAISGIAESASATSRSFISCMIEPCDSQSPLIPFRAYVLPRFTSYFPRREANDHAWRQFEGLRLADPEPTGDEKIDLIIGADLYAAILRNGVRSGRVGEPIAQETIFGWVISGPLPTSGTSFPSRVTTMHHCSIQEPLDTTLRRFWEIEELNCKVGLSEDEEWCETHFLSSHSRDHEGRYTVRLPLRSELPLKIGESFAIARKCLERQEKRLLLQPQRQLEYDKFLREYYSLGHMVRSTQRLNPNPKPVYLPHHAVIRETSSTSPLRVVFNASRATTNGSSLNDHLHVGPQLLPPLLTIILRWRTHYVALRADIEKMFRQIRVHPADTHLQRIFCRLDRKSDVEIFDLSTVTYGTGPATWMAIRVLQQLANDERSPFPKAAHVLANDFYVDDALTGASSIEEARELQRELQALLLAGGFNLRKWASSHPEVLDDPANASSTSTPLTLDEKEAVKVLGLLWDIPRDAFRFTTTLDALERVTKRTALSAIARIFDPVGWLTPTTVTAKIFIQELWLRNIGWDENLPEELSAQWVQYYRELTELQKISIPRFVGYFKQTDGCDLHGFADASTRAYAAVVYLRVSHENGDFTVTLLIGKSKVAPTKQLTVARLELCAAHLLSRVIETTQQSMDLKSVPVHAWSDSEIVLAWLRRHASHWPTFVANRVSDIQSRIPQARWRHVPSADNPADCASRGLSPSELVEHSLWWDGPRWLKAHSINWPCAKPSRTRDSKGEIEAIATALVARKKDEVYDLHERFSSWPKLLRVSARCLAVRCCSRRAEIAKPTMTQLVERARIFWISQVQRAEFSDEFSVLRLGQTLPSRSRLLRLHPFIDDKGLLRLGGCLSAASVSYEEKHPIILPDHRITRLIIEQAHQRSMHGGTQLTIRTLRQSYWILGGRRLIRSVIFKCVRCTRYRAQGSNQLMGDLPKPRVTKSRPFSHTGIDYAGPFLIRTSKGRGQRTEKGYVVLFVCLTVRAIHLELASDYTTQGFLAAFQRFVSRRGLPSDLYSDNGTNLVGADRELRRTMKVILRDPNLEGIMANDRINWHFIPASAPHFGGIWEAGIKSTKFHLKRLMENMKPTYEEMSTLLAKIEANLNSRPIAPLGEDPHDLAALTPGHFLIRGPLTAVPEESLLDVNVNRLSRWQMLQQINESFWRRWKHEYMLALQQRKKWARENDNLRLNELVLIRDQQIPPAKWPLGRVTVLHPGSDGLVRVATVKTATSVLKQPLVKLVRLNINPCAISSVDMAGGLQGEESSQE